MVAPKDIEKAVAAIENDVFSTFENEIESRRLGELVMDHLRDLDVIDMQERKVGCDLHAERVRLQQGAKSARHRADHLVGRDKRRSKPEKRVEKVDGRRGWTREVDGSRK